MSEIGGRVVTAGLRARALAFGYRRRGRDLRVPWLSFGVLGVVAVCAVFAPLLAPYDPARLSLLDARLAPLSPGHLLGTDLLGRDILSRLIFGARSSATVATTALLAAVVVGALVGLIAGYAGATVDRIAMRVTDAVLGFPAILTAMLIVVVLGQGVQNVVLAVVLTTWPRFARMLRGEVLRYREREFVQFAKVSGVGSATILVRHILPNVASTLIVVSTLMIAEVILLEASLSFLGLGFPPGAPAWGIMVAEGREVLRQAWWLSVFPGLVITSVVVAINFVGDWLGDVLDPNRRATVVPGVEIAPLEPSSEAVPAT
jgi:peptide/nickel transport system permease protein